MNYEIEKLRKASLFLLSLSEELEHGFLDDEGQYMASEDLEAHIERLILVLQKLKGSQQDISVAKILLSSL